MMSILAFQMFFLRAPSSIGVPQMPDASFQKLTRAPRSLSMPGHRNDAPHKSTLPR